MPPCLLLISNYAPAQNRFLLVIIYRCVQLWNSITLLATTFVPHVAGNSEINKNTTNVSTLLLVIYIFKKNVENVECSSDKLLQGEKSVCFKVWCERFTKFLLTKKMFKTIKKTTKRWFIEKFQKCFKYHITESPYFFEVMHEKSYLISYKCSRFFILNCCIFLREPINFNSYKLEKVITRNSVIYSITLKFELQTII